MNGLIVTGNTIADNYGVKQIIEKNLFYYIEFADYILIPCKEKQASEYEEKLIQEFNSNNINAQIESNHHETTIKK